MAATPAQATGVSNVALAMADKVGQDTSGADKLDEDKLDVDKSGVDRAGLDNPSQSNTDLSSELQLARFVVHTTLAEVPASALQTIKWVLLAVIGTGVAGAWEEGIAELRALLVDRAGKPEATSLVFADALPATSAAQLNAAMCRALDYCDAMAPGPHFGSAIVPAAFAVAQSLGGCSGATLLEALVVGAEIGARFNLSERMYDGFDPTGIAGVFAATATASRLLALTEVQTVNALALAFNRCGGSFQSHVDGSLAVRLVQGFVAETGVWCAQMAARGLTGPKNFLDGHYGYRHLYAKGLRDSASFTEGLKTRWLLETIVFKKYPSCGVTQGVTNQTLELITELNLQPSDLEYAEVHLPPYASKLVGTPFVMGDNPRVNAQFSAQYCVANAIWRGASKLDHFRPSAIAEAGLQTLIAKVRVISDPAMDARGHSAVDLMIRTRGGRSAQRSYDVSPGFPGRGLSASEHQARFEDCMAYASARALEAGEMGAGSASRTATILDAVNSMEQLSNVVPFWASIR
jgi:2-methylcitrate dehydratase PrpD